jgi:hypothetical protein
MTYARDKRRKKIRHQVIVKAKKIILEKHGTGLTSKDVKQLLKERKCYNTA